MKQQNDYDYQIIKNSYLSVKDKNVSKYQYFIKHEEIGPEEHKTAEFLTE